MSISEELPLKTSRGKCSEATPADISTISLRWFPKFCYRLFYRFVVSSAVVRGARFWGFSWPGGWAPKAKVDVDMQTRLMRCWLFCSAFCATANPWRVLDRRRAVGRLDPRSCCGRHWVRTSDLSRVSKVDLHRVLELRRSRCVRGRLQHRRASRCTGSHLGWTGDRPRLDRCVTATVTAAPPR